MRMQTADTAEHNYCVNNVASSNWKDSITIAITMALITKSIEHKYCEI